MDEDVEVHALVTAARDERTISCEGHCTQRMRRCENRKGPFVLLPSDEIMTPWNARSWNTNLSHKTSQNN